MNCYNNTLFFFMLYDLKNNFKRSQKSCDNKHLSIKQDYNIKRLFRAFVNEYSYYNKEY